MILLLGGAGETSRIAEELAEAGYRVLVSTATEIPLTVASHRNIARRTGPLDERDACLLIAAAAVRALVDCAHPYAEKVHETAMKSAEASGIPCFRYVRPESALGREDVLFAADHAEAAKIACSFGCTVFVTTGVRNLRPYAEEAKKTGVNLAVRVLPEAASLQACADAGIDARRIVSGRGPFSVEKNRQDMNRFSAGVLVTKDGGTVGGVPEKLEAARLEGCRIVMVRRPEIPAGYVFENLKSLIDAVVAKVPID